MATPSAFTTPVDHNLAGAEVPSSTPNFDVVQQPVHECYIGANCVKRHIFDAKHRLLDPSEVMIGVFHGDSLTREEYGLTAARKGGFSLHDYLIVTDRRVLVWARGVFKESVDSYHFDDISSVEATSGILLGELVFNVRGAKERFRSMASSDAGFAGRMIQARIAAQKSLRPSAPARVEGASSVFEALDRLGGLRDRGLIEQGEFEAKKKELLGRL